MKLIERYKLIKSKYPDYIVLIKCGTFYNTFYKDAEYISRFQGYRIIDNRVGFPISILNSINISNYVLVDNLEVRVVNDRKCL